MVLESLLCHGPADGPIYNETKRYGDLESGLDTADLNTQALSDILHK